MVANLFSLAAGEPLRKLLRTGRETVYAATLLPQRPGLESTVFNHLCYDASSQCVL